MTKILDFHAHVGHDKDERSNSLRQLLRSMKKYGVTSSVVFPLNERDMTVEDASLKLRDKSKDLPLYPFFRFDPHNMTPERLKERLTDFYGVKLHPRAQKFDPLDEKWFPLYEAITDSEKPLLIHTRYQCVHDQPGRVIPNMNPDRIVGLGKHFPKLYLVIAHFGNGSFYVLQEMKKQPRTYLETSILGSAPATIEMAVEAVGPDRILFGSDVPYSKQYIEYRKIRESRLSRKDKEKILYHNAAHLIKLE